MAAAQLFGVLDCARDPQLYEHAARMEPHAAECLFAGKLSETVRRASPFVVELAPSDPLSAAWRGQGWGAAWGVLISTRSDGAALRARLRRLTQVRLPDGSGPMLFRFWDPRVLRVFMPLIEPDGLSAWFAPGDRWIVESEDGAGSIRFGGDAGAVSVEPGPRPR